MSILTVDRLSKKYPSFLLDDVSFSLEKGRITGFIGRNGAGTTTTIKAMLNLIHPDGGDIRYFGMDLSGNEAAIKQRVGYSTGAVNYYPRRKLSELISVTKTFYDNWDEEACETCLKLFSLDPNKAPHELSEGMKVKVNLLLALSHRAELLILDEPTSGLDPFSRDELTDLFTELRRRGMTVFFSTHITSDLDKCADDIVYIRNGRIVSSGSIKAFREESGQSGETLEDTMLRLEKEARNA